MYKLPSLLPFNQHLHTQVAQSFRWCASQVETLYDVLQVPKNCSNQEVREAFVQLSKKFHPDVKGVNSDPKLTEQFVKISEAYQILSKPKLRNAYDHDLWVKNVGEPSRRYSGMHTTETHKPWEVKLDVDANPGPYYGIPGLDRMSNSKIAWLLIAVGVFCALFGFASLRHRFTQNRHQLDEKSEQASLHHAQVRADAAKYGNEEQLRRMVTRMLKNGQ